MTDPMSPQRRRAEEAYALLTHAVSPMQRAVDDAEAEAQERARKTERLRNARLERERSVSTGLSTPTTRRLHTLKTKK